MPLFELTTESHSSLPLQVVGPLFSRRRPPRNLLHHRTPLPEPDSATPPSTHLLGRSPLPPCCSASLLALWLLVTASSPQLARHTAGGTHATMLLRARWSRAVCAYAAPGGKAGQVTWVVARPHAWPTRPYGRQCDLGRRVVRPSARFGPCTRIVFYYISFRLNPRRCLKAYKNHIK
jgi:hypothetical protein